MDKLRSGRRETTGGMKGLELCKSCGQRQAVTEAECFNIMQPYECFVKMDRLLVIPFAVIRLFDSP